jgi:hypothetical protein
MTTQTRDLRTTADLILTLVCALGALLAGLDVHSGLRPVVILVGLVIGTGWAATSWIEITDAAFAAGVALATGVSITFLYGLFFIEIGWWHPVDSVIALLAVAAVVNGAALAHDLLRRRAS